MSAIEARVEEAIGEITGNEALLEMLETEAAVEMLDWGKSMAVSLIDETGDLDDSAANLVLEPRLKAVRQIMRSAGNWAAGKYTNPEDRIRLREKLLEELKIIRGEAASLPSADKLDTTINQVDDRRNTPQQLILKLKELLDEPR